MADARRPVECPDGPNACVMAMIDVGGMVTEVRRTLDCADVCDATEHVLSRGPATDATLEAALIQACIHACQTSSEARGAHADHHEHCRLHSQSAARCADTPRKLAGSLAG